MTATTPNDVLESVEGLKGLVCFLCLFVAVMMVLVIYGTFRIVATGRKVSRELETAARHGRMTDDQRVESTKIMHQTLDVLKACTMTLQRLGVAVSRGDPSEQLQAATTRVTEEIRQVPERTADLVSKRMDQDYSHDNTPASGTSDHKAKQP